MVLRQTKATDIGADDDMMARELILPDVPCSLLFSLGIVKILNVELKREDAIICQRPLRIFITIYFD